MQKTLLTLAILLVAGAPAFAAPQVSDGLEYSLKNIQKTNRKVTTRDEVCVIAGGVARAAWTYQDQKAVFPFDSMNSKSPFFPLYLWAYQYGTHKAPDRGEAFTGAVTMCAFNANKIYEASQAGRPLGAADLKCPADLDPACK